MHATEKVTTFSPGEPEKEGKLITEIIAALREHTKGMAEESDFTCNMLISWDNPQMRIPAKYIQLIAYAVEGTNEGYYVRVGCLQYDNTLEACGLPKSIYTDWGSAKTYSPESAYALAREAQRFLTAMRWN